MRSVIELYCFADTVFIIDAKFVATLYQDIFINAISPESVDQQHILAIKQL